MLLMFESCCICMGFFMFVIIVFKGEFWICYIVERGDGLKVDGEYVFKKG